MINKNAPSDPPLETAKTTAEQLKRLSPKERRIYAAFKERVKNDALKMFKPHIAASLTQSQIEDAVAEALKGVTEFDVAMVLAHGETFCAKCGECCRQSDPILLSAEDIHVLCNLCGTANVQNLIVKRKDMWYFKRTKPCFFLRDNKCSIYQHRPLVCRAFPLVEYKGSEQEPMVSLGFYPYCNIALQISVRKTVSFITGELIKTRDPELNERMKRSFDPIRKKLLEAKTHKERLEIIEQYLIPRDFKT